MTGYLPLTDFRCTVRNWAVAFRFPASSRSLKKVLILRFSRCILPGCSGCFLSLSHHHPRDRRHLPPALPQDRLLPPKYNFPDSADISAALPMPAQRILPFFVASVPAGSLRPDMLFHPVHLPRVRSPQVYGCAAPVVCYLAAFFAARANPAHSREYRYNDSSCFPSSSLNHRPKSPVKGLRRVVDFVQLCEQRFKNIREL